MDALLPVSNTEGPDLDEKGVVVVGPCAARWAGARMRRRALIIQLLTCDMDKPVAWHNCFFSSSEG